jgi:hypothetical protein
MSARLKRRFARSVFGTTLSCGGGFIFELDVAFARVPSRFGGP